MDIVRRIAVLEGQIEEMVSELARLKVATTTASSPPPALPIDIFYPNGEQKPDLKELFVLFDFETGGKFL